MLSGGWKRRCNCRTAPSPSGRWELRKVLYVKLHIRNPMSSAGLCVAPGGWRWQGRWRRPDAAHNPGGLEAGEPVKQFGVLVPFGQVGGDEVGVDGFEGLAFGLGGGARVDLGGGW